MDRIRAAGFGVELIPGALALALFVVWALTEGGFEPTAWYPGALFVAGLLVAIAVPLARRAPLPPRLSLLAIAAFAAFTVWGFISIVWADAPGDAWDGSNRTLLYLTVFALFALPAWRPASAAALLGAFSVAIAAVGVVVVVDASSSADPTLSFIHGSLAEPTGYHNATAALLCGAVFGALALASRREAPWAVRGLLLASATVLVEISLLAQSRGSLIAFPIATAVYLIAMPQRSRAIVAALPVAAAAALAAPTLLDVYPAADDGDPAAAAALDDALRAIGLSFVAVLGLGTLAAFADSRLRPPEGVSRAGRWAVASLAAAGLVAAVAVALNATGDPVDWADERWEEFKAGEQEGTLADSRFAGGLGTNRYDFWRVALNEARDRPLTGSGIESFAVDYVRERRSDEEPLHPHSLPIRIVSQTGLVGALLFASFLVLAVAAAVRARARAGAGLAAAIWAGAIASFAYWFVHSSADWLWAFPALTAPALAWLALAGRLEGVDGPGGDPKPETRSRVGALAIIATVVLALAVAASYALPWTAARDVERAAASWGANPEAAYERLDRARDLNPLSDRADLVAGAIAVRLDDLAGAREAFGRALDRRPEAWYPLLMLGAIDAVEGERAAAIAHLDESRRANPRDPLVRSVLADVRRDRPVRLDEIEAALVGRICERVGRTEDTDHC